MNPQLTITPREFFDKWRHAELKERSAAQEHFIDICNLLGHRTPAEADPEGESFTFEAGAKKQSGGQGWADVWKRGFFAWEYKGKHADLDKAYNQLLQYREALRNPPLLIVSDIERIRIHTNFTNTVKKVYELSLEDLLDPHKKRILRDAFYDPDQLKAPETPEQVTEAAAEEFGRLADQLRSYRDAPPNDEIAHFLIRLLFCLFAEDADLLPQNIFSTLIERTQGHSKAFQQQLRQLFGAMREGGWFGPEEIRFFDGRLFDDNQALELDGDGMHTLARISRLDWSSIEPSIFGTLFERSLDPSKRSQLGAHYTSREDIELIVEPVLMKPLRRRWEEVKKEAEDLAEQRDAATTKSATTRRQNQITELLQSFAREIADVEVLDPACGSGNFLYVALRQLLNLEKEVITLAGQLGSPMFFPSVSPEQLHGIEVNPYAQELAQVTIWIGYIQWMQDNGYGFPSEPILKPLDAIQRKDAILAYDKNGNPTEPEWPEADVIIGNPPFLGSQKLRGELGDEYCEDLFVIYGGRVPASSDLVCYWFEKARNLIQHSTVKRAGLLATQAIRGGANRVVLERIKETGDIFWARSDREWVLEGAMVHVSMVGFDDGSETKRKLDGEVVPKINPDLTSYLDLTRAKKLPANENIAFQGPVKVGPFDIDNETAKEMLSSSNPHSASNERVIKPWMNASDITKRPRGMYIIDFDELDIQEAALFEGPFEYVKTHVKPMREGNRNRRRREFWWRLGRSGANLKKAKAPLERMIITPRVSKHRIFIWVESELLPDSAVVAIALDSDYCFGVLHSRLHELWSRNVGTQLRDAKSGSRYTPTTCFETYPFPWSLGTEPNDNQNPRVRAIAEATRELVELRQHWLNPGSLPANILKKRTLTNLYNQNPTWLQLAHEKLDNVVLDAYGWPHDLEDEEVLERLLELNLERAREE